MKQFIRTLKSDGYKAIHSTLLLVHLLIPLLGTATFLAYYTVSLWDEPQQVSAYLQALAMAFPLLICMITVIASEQELQAGSFQMMLCIPCKKCVSSLGKIAALLIMCLLSSIIAVLGFGIVFRVMGNVTFPISLYLKAAMLLFLGNLPLYMLQYMISFAFGKGIGLSFGIVGSLLSALLLTGLGDCVWSFLPWSLATRFCSMLVECEVTNTSFIDCAGVDKGFTFILFSGTILLFVLKVWSEKWEGRKNETDL